MPTLLREGPYRILLLIWATGQNLPTCTCSRTMDIAKFWLDPVALQN